jgi:MFS family permease
MLIISLCLLLFINAMSIGLVFPIFAPLFTLAHAPLFSANTPLSTQTLFYTLILAAPTLCIVFSAPFWGRISDRKGRKIILITSLLGIATSFGLSALGIYLGSLIVLFASRIFAGFMDGSESVAQAALVDFSAPGDKARNLGFATFAGTIGFIIGPILGGFLAEPSLTGRFHYEIPFVLSLILTCANALILSYSFPKETTVTALSPPQASYFKLLSKGFSFCFDRRIRAYSFLLFVLQWSLAAFFQLSTLVLVEKFHYSSGQVGLFTTFLGACFSGGIFFVIHVLLRRVAHVKLLKLGIGLLCFAIVSAIYFRHSTLIAWVSVVPMMVGIAMMYNVLLAFISNAVTEAEQGEAMGSGTALKALGWLVSGVIVGYLYSHLLLVLCIMLFVAVLAFITAMFLKQSQQ